MQPKLLHLTLLSTTVLSAAIPSLSFAPLTSRAASSAVSQLLLIAPTSSTCAGSPFPSECATATQAAPHLITAMQTYKIYSPSELSALLSLIAYETGDFKYAINHFPSPGRPGQGTRNMQMASFNLAYAKSIPALAGSLAAITTANSVDGLSDDQLNAIRALVLPDEYAWASAAWFLTSQCASARPALQAGGQAGLDAYLACVGTTATSDRLAYWERANQAFGIA